MLKFLADVNMEKTIVDDLRERGYDTRWMLEDAPFLEDQAILKLANDEGRVLLTNDKDFGEIVFRQKSIATGVILFRLRGQNAFDKRALLRKLLETYSHLILNRFIVVSNDKFRILHLTEANP